MITETIIPSLNQWQFTIPLSWLKFLWIEKNGARAFLRGNQIVIESVKTESLDRDVDKISFDELNEETQNAIIQSRKDYQSGKVSQFMSSDEVRNDVL